MNHIMTHIDVREIVARMTFVIIETGLQGQQKYSTNTYERRKRLIKNK